MKKKDGAVNAVSSFLIVYELLLVSSGYRYEVLIS